MSSDIRPTTSGRRNRTVAGIALIGIGLLVVVSQFIAMPWVGMLFLPMLGALFLLWGIATRNVGLMIPGGILSGIGAGTLMIGGPLQGIPDQQSGGIFLLCFGAGWIVITLLSALFADETHRWPLIPGGVMLLIGGALLAGGAALNVLELVARAWPVGLIAFGLYLLLRRRSAQE